MIDGSFFQGASFDVPLSGTSWTLGPSDSSKPSRTRHCRAASSTQAPPARSPDRSSTRPRSFPTSATLRSRTTHTRRSSGSYRGSPRVDRSAHGCHSNRHATRRYRIALDSKCDDGSRRDRWCGRTSIAGADGAETTAFATRKGGVYGGPRRTLGPRPSRACHGQWLRPFAAVNSLRAWVPEC